MPPGAKATALTCAVCPVKRNCSVPAAASQTRTSLSAPHVARSLPSEEKATQRTAPRVGGDPAPQHGGGVIPEVGPAVAAPGDERLAVGGEAERDHLAAVPAQLAELRAGVQVPELHGAIPVPDGHPRAVGRDGQRADAARVAEHAQLLAGRRVPDPDGAGVGAGHQGLAVRGVGDRRGDVGVAEPGRAQPRQRAGRQRRLGALVALSPLRRGGGRRNRGVRPGLGHE